MTWFEKLTGFRETSPDLVRLNMTVRGDTLTSLVNQRKFICGRLETPSLGELRGRVGRGRQMTGRLKVREVIADVSDLHTEEANAGCLFQVASQFNLLEMANSTVVPELGVGIYESDHTQGPACAIAAGAGTIYRNYFAVVNGRIGQSAGNQIDCLADLGTALGNSQDRLWRMENGYALASRDGLDEISERLATSSESETDRLRQLLRIGVQWGTQVTIRGSKHMVTQAYCSALPVSYSRHSPGLWESFARLVLQASYEATICAAILNARNTNNHRVFLTLLGGGAFGNTTDWIMESITRALKLYEKWDLDVAIVSYGASKEYVRQLTKRFS